MERSRARTQLDAKRIEYRVLDATDPEQLLALGRGQFHAAVCNMVLMDMAAIEPLLDALPALRKSGGRFVFSVTHPCFNSVGVSKIAEEKDHDGEMATRFGVKVTCHISPVVRRGLGIIRQPAPQIYFHRPLSALLNACFVLDRLEEPVFEREAPNSRPFARANYREIPPVLVARLWLPSLDPVLCQMTRCHGT